MSRNLFKQESSPARPRESSSAQRPADAPEKPRRKRREETGSLSVLGIGIEVRGEITARGDIQIEGRVVGDISVEGQVSVTLDGSVEGHVTADRIVVAGRIDGSITAAEGVRLVAGARVDADITSQRLELEDGATLNGRVNMGKRSEKAAAPGPTAVDGPGKSPKAAQGAA